MEEKKGQLKERNKNGELREVDTINSGSRDTSGKGGGSSNP
jgi:hypothetical protein